MWTNGINHFMLPSVDMLSIEANNDEYDFQTYNLNRKNDDIRSLLNNNMFDEFSLVDGECESANLIESIKRAFEPNELDQYFGPQEPFNTNFDIDRNLLSTSLSVENPKPRKTPKGNKKAILLSSSVDIGIPPKVNGKLFSTSSTDDVEVSAKFINALHAIEIVYPLEEKFRLRYKSDYFALSGKNRRPRYVADRKGNHFITLKVPMGVRGQIRVDWLTLPTETGFRYIMPYQFQASNDSPDVPDCNPLFVNIDANSSGEMKLYLVLIKAKQDILKNLKSLEPFCPLHEIFGETVENPEKNNKLTPKTLIKQFQLHKSQLAFTLCVETSDGKSCIPEWDTTVYSTVLEEETGEPKSKKTVSCPKCSYEILTDFEEQTPTPTPPKRRSATEKTCTAKRIMKKQKSVPHEFYCLD